MEPVFIVGQYKCGTSWLLRALSAHRDIVGVAEIDIVRSTFDGLPDHATLRSPEDRLESFFASSAFSRDDIRADLAEGRHPTARVPKAENPRNIRDLDPVTAAVMYRRIKWANQPGQVLDAFLEGVTTDTDASHVVLKAADQITVVDFLDEWAPGCRKIVITRDGRDAAISAEHFRRLMRQEHAPWYSGSAEFAELLDAWADRARLAIELAGRGELYLIRYEDLTSSFTETIQPLLGWLDLEATEGVIDHMEAESSFQALTGRPRGTDGPGPIRKGAVGEWRDALDDETAEKAWSAAGGTLADLGYTPTGEIRPLPAGLQPTTLPLMRSVSTATSTAADGSPHPADRTPGDGPLISVIVVMYNMRREAARTLASLVPEYQRGCSADDYEVVVVDSGSNEPLDAAMVEGFGPNFSYLFHDSTSPSPAEAVNAAVRASSGRWITVCIDGARILSPGIVAHSIAAMRAYHSAVVATLGWHVGHEAQQDAVLNGYDQAVEDLLLDGAAWEEDGYRLFDVSTLAGSSRGGWFLPISESNCLTLSRALYEDLGGMDEGFVSRGGGLVNLDFYRRACEVPDIQVVLLLGEGTFHQFHGGVSTNVPRVESPVRGFIEEYEALRGHKWQDPPIDPVFLGSMPPGALPVLGQSVQTAEEQFAKGSRFAPPPGAPAPSRLAGKRAVVVLGMHRSGTSALTRVTSLLGAGLPDNLMPESDDNARGYWESWDMADLNNAILAAAGTAWNHDGSISSDWLTSAAVDEFRPRAREFLEEAFRDAALLALKDPRMCRLLPFWKSVFAELGIDARYVLIVRHPEEVFRSLEARLEKNLAGIGSPDRAHLLWLRYVLDAERYSRDTDRSILTYQGLLTDWRTTIQRVATESGIVFPMSIARAAPEIDEFLSDGYRHHSADAEGATHSALASEVYEIFAAHANAGAPLDQRRLDAASRAFGSVEQAYAPLRMPIRRNAGSAWDGELLGRIAHVAGRAADPTPRVLYLSERPDTRGHVYRVTHHVAALKAAGIEARWMPLNPTALAAVETADTVVVFRSRWNALLERIYARCRDRGVPVGFDIDDLVFDPELTTVDNLDLLQRMNAKKRRAWRRDYLNRYNQTLTESDFALVSTAPLAAAAERQGTTAFVVPNGLDAAMIAQADDALAARGERPSAQDSRLRMGYASGTPTHQRDFGTIADVVAGLLDERSDLLLTVVGYINAGEFPNLNRHRDRIEVRPAVPHAELFAEFARLDINLAPLVCGNPFCEGKSELKYYEAALVEVPTVAAATEPFRAAIDQGVTGYATCSEQGWREALTTLIDDPATRLRIGAKAREHSIATFGPLAQSRAAYQAVMTVARTSGHLGEVAADPIEVDAALQLG